ncbi:MAG: hypothetical protein ACUVQT_10445 [bacterium]
MIIIVNGYGSKNEFKRKSGHNPRIEKGSILENRIFELVKFGSLSGINLRKEA